MKIVALFSDIAFRAVDSYHDYFDSLGYWVGFVVLLFLQDTSEVAQLPDRMSLTALSGQLRKAEWHFRQNNSFFCSFEQLRQNFTHLKHQ